MFLPDLDAFRKCVRISNQFKSEAILDTRYDHLGFLYQYFGIPFTAQIEGYSSSASGTPEKTLFDCFERILAKRMLIGWIPQNEVNIHDSGITRVETSEEKTAYASQIHRLLQSHENDCYNLLDVIVGVCSVNTISNYSTTPIAKMLAKTIFSSVSEFNDVLRMEYPAATFFKIAPFIVQSHDVLAQFPTAAIDAMKASASSITTQAFDHLKYGIANLAMYEAMKKGLVSFSPDKGVRFIGFDQEQSFQKEVIAPDSKVNAQLHSYKKTSDLKIGLAFQLFSNSPASFGVSNYVAPEVTKTTFIA